LKALVFFEAVLLFIVLWNVLCCELWDYPDYYN